MGPTEPGEQVSSWRTACPGSAYTGFLRRNCPFYPILCRVPGLGLVGKVQGTRVRENNDGNVLMYVSEIAHVEWLAVCLNLKLTWVSRVLNGYAWHLQQRLPWPSFLLPFPGESSSNEVLPVLNTGDSSVGSHRNLLILRLKSPEETQLVVYRCGAG